MKRASSSGFFMLTCSKGTGSAVCVFASQGVLWSPVMIISAS